MPKYRKYTPVRNTRTGHVGFVSHNDSATGRYVVNLTRARRSTKRADPKEYTRIPGARVSKHLRAAIKKEKLRQKRAKFSSAPRAMSDNDHAPCPNRDRPAGGAAAPPCDAEAPPSVQAGRPERPGKRPRRDRDDDDFRKRVGKRPRPHTVGGGGGARRPQDCCGLECPVCLDPIGAGVVLLNGSSGRCGHCMCLGCYNQMVGNRPDAAPQRPLPGRRCPVCREHIWEIDVASCAPERGGYVRGDDSDVEVEDKSGAGPAAPRHAPVTIDVSSTDDDSDSDVEYMGTKRRGDGDVSAGRSRHGTWFKKAQKAKDPTPDYFKESQEDFAWYESEKNRLCRHLYGDDATYNMRGDNCETSRGQNLTYGFDDIHNEYKEASDGFDDIHNEYKEASDAARCEAEGGQWYDDKCHKQIYLHEVDDEDEFMDPVSE